MAVTVIDNARASGNTLLRNQKPDISSVLTKLMPYQTPLTQYMFFGQRKSKVVKNKVGKFEFMEDELLPHNLACLVNVTPTGDNLVFTPTNLENVKALKLYDIVLMESTGEQGWVISISGTDYTVAQMEDGEDQTATALTGITAGDNVKIIGNAQEEGSNGTNPRTTQVINNFNYLTIFEETIITTDRDEAGDEYANVDHTYQVEKKMLEMKTYFERNFMLALKAGFVTGADGKRRTYGKGLDGLISTNVTNYATLDEPTFFAHMRAVGLRGTGKKTHYAGGNQYYTLQDIVRAKIGNLPSLVKTPYGVKVMDFVYGDVETRLIHNPILDEGKSDTGFTVDEKYLTPRHMANDKKGSRKMRIRKNVQDNRSNTTETQLLADIGMELRYETAHGKLEKS